MRRKLIYILILAILLISVSVYFSHYFREPIKEQERPEAPKPVSIELREENTQLYSLLYGMGLNPLVDVTEERVLVRYNLPEGMNEETYYRVLAYSAKTSPNSETIIIQIYRNYHPYMEIKANTQDVLSWIEGKISKEDLSKRFVRREIK